MGCLVRKAKGISGLRGEGWGGVGLGASWLGAGPTSPDPDRWPRWTRAEATRGIPPSGLQQLARLRLPSSRSPSLPPGGGGATPRAPLKRIHSEGPYRRNSRALIDQMACQTISCHLLAASPGYRRGSPYMGRATKSDAHLGSAAWSRIISSSLHLQLCKTGRKERGVGSATKLCFLRPFFLQGQATTAKRSLAVG